VNRKPRFADRIIQAIAVATLLAAWEWGSAAGYVDAFVLPPPSKIWAAFAQLVASGEIWVHIWATFSAALMGLVVGSLLGALLAVVAVASRPAALLVEPLMSALNAVPRIVLAPLMVIWFGIGISSKVALAVSLVAVLIFFAVYTAIAQVDRRLIERVRTLGGDRRLLLTEVYLPSVASYVLSSLKVAVGFALTGVIVGEFVAASEGLGYLLSFAQSSFNAALSLAIIGLIMAFVMILLSLTERLERRLLRWR
jgi:NitT/TauT family transport system permease protein